MKKLSALLSLVALMIVTSANAATFTEANKTPREVGANAQMNMAYFFVTEGLQLASCANGGVVWIQMDTAGIGKLIYATVLTAQATNKKISYLNYSVDASNNCYAIQVGIAE